MARLRKLQKCSQKKKTDYKEDATHTHPRSGLSRAYTSQNCHFSLSRQQAQAWKEIWPESR
jgi:hypothetical protein